MSQQQFVSLIVSSMRQAHGQDAPALTQRQACFYERSDHPDLATIWRRAHDQMLSCILISSCLAELGYIPENSETAQRKDRIDIPADR